MTCNKLEIKALIPDNALLKTDFCRLNCAKKLKKISRRSQWTAFHKIEDERGHQRSRLCLSLCYFPRACANLRFADETGERLLTAENYETVNFLLVT